MMIAEFIRRAIMQGIPLLFGSTGEILTEKSGNLNLGIPGIMYVGGISGVIGAFLYEKSLSSADALNPALAVAIPLLCSLVGSLLKIKPILKGDEEGKIISCGKARGKQAALLALAEKYDSLAKDRSSDIGIAHADDIKDAEFLLGELRRKGFTGNCLTVCYEPVTGAHVGPGTVALFFPGIHK